MNPEVISSPFGPTPEEIAALQRELSVRAAFERMISASLRGAALTGAVSLALGLGAAALDGAGLTRLMSVAIGSLSLACIVFFGGFMGAIIIGVPLTLALEGAGVRRGPPYILAALLVNAVLFVGLTGAPPDFRNLEDFLYLAPGPLIAFLYLRDIAPIWRRSATQRARAEVIRLH